MQWYLNYFSWRREWRMGIFISLVLACLYGLSMPQYITFEDAGLIVTACYYGGILHPPGYPLYSMLCAAFAQLSAVLPITPVQATALLSVMSAIATCLCFYEIVRRLGSARYVAAVAAITLAAGARFWSQAIIPEVYTLNAFLVAATVVMIMRFLRTYRRPNFFLLCLCVGGGIANHWPLYIVNAPVFILLLFPKWRHWWQRRALWLSGGGFVLLVVVVLYSYLLLFPWLGGTLVFGGAPQEWEQFVAYVTREIYVLRAMTQITSLQTCINSVGTGFYLLADEYTLLGGVVALLGIVVLFRRHYSYSLAVVVGAVASAPLLGGYLCADTDSGIGYTVFSAYPLPAMIFLMWLIVEGLKITRQWSKPLITVLAIIVISVNYQANNRRDEHLADNYARAVLHSLPEGATLLVDSDFEFPIRYMHYVVGVREDVRLVNNVDVFKEATTKKFYISDHSYLSYRHDWGLVKTLADDDKAAIAATIPQPLMAFYNQLIPDYYQYSIESERQWDRFFIQRAIFSAARALTPAYDSGVIDDDERQLLLQLIQTPEGLFGQLSARLLGRGKKLSVGDIRHALAIIQRSTQSFSLEWRAQLLHQEGILDFIEGHRAQAKQKWLQSIDLDITSGNPAVIDVLQLLAADNEWQQYQALRQRYRIVNNPALDESDTACRQIIPSCIVNISDEKK